MTDPNVVKDFETIITKGKEQEAYDMPAGRYLDAVVHGIESATPRQEKIRLVEAMAPCGEKLMICLLSEDEQWRIPEGWVAVPPPHLRGGV